MTNEITIDKATLNAKVSSVELVIGTNALLLLAMQERSLAPLRLSTLGIITWHLVMKWE